MLLFTLFFIAALLLLISGQLGLINDRLKDSFPTEAERWRIAHPDDGFKHWSLVAKSTVVIGALLAMVFMWNR